MTQVFGEDGLEVQGMAALEGLKEFMVVGTDSVHYVIVSSYKNE